MESLPKQWHRLAAEAECLLGCSQPYPSGWRQRFPVEIPPWTKCHFRGFFAGADHPLLLALGTTNQAEPVPVTNVSGAPTLPCPRVAGFWQGLCCCPVPLTLPKLPPAPAAGLEPRRAHPHWLSSGTFVGKCESVTNVGIHLFHISRAALS